MDHQFSLFGFQKPSTKIAISKARILEAKAELEKGKAGNQRTLLEGLRYLNDKLENFEQSITHANQNENARSR
jgi:hypothetical protein